MSTLDGINRKRSKMVGGLAWTRRNALSSLRIQREVRDSQLPIASLNRYEKRLYSQNGEDGILEAILTRLGTTNRYFVEFGAGNGKECNTARLTRDNWTGLLMDICDGTSPAGLPIYGAFVTAENVETVFTRHQVPQGFDLLSIDIDGNDYWVWKAIHSYAPRIVIIEYNASVPPERAMTIAYEPTFRWGGTDYFGASLRALKELGESKGYKLLACDNSGTNAFFVQEDLAAGKFSPRTISDVYRSPGYSNGQGHPPDPSRTLIDI